MKSVVHVVLKSLQSLTIQEGTQVIEHVGDVQRIVIIIAAGYFPQQILYCIRLGTVVILSPGLMDGGNVFTGSTMILGMILYTPLRYRPEMGHVD